MTTVWYPAEFSSAYTTAFSGVALSPFSVESTYGPELRFYKDRPRTISFEITSAQWVPAGNNTLYYFLYPSVASITGDEQIEAQTEMSAGMTILTAPTNDVAVPVTHVPFRLLFDDNSVVSIADYNDGPQATESSVTLRYTAEGRYLLTVMTNDLTRAARTWDVEVVDGAMPARVEIAGKSYLAVGSNQKLSATVFGEDDSEAYDQTVSRKVSDESVATIDVEGNLTTLKEGEVTVTATTTDSASEPVEATFTVYVVATINEEVAVVEVAQTHRTDQQNSGEVTEKFAWWVSKDDLNKTATIIAPQTTVGAYNFAYPGLASEDSPTAATKHFWTPALTGFYGDDTHFTAVRLPATVEIDGEEYTVTAIGERAFAGSNIAYINLPSTIETIGDYAFENATSLAGIGVASAYELVPNSVTSLGLGAFKGCTSLTRIDIGDGVTEIKEETFEGCTVLKQISIGSIVARISCALEGLDAIAFHGATPPTVSALSASTIWVPAENEAAYAAAFSTANIETFSVVPAQESLKFYTGVAHEIEFDIKSAPWISEGDNSLYYFVYEALRYSQLAPAHKANASLVASNPDNPDGITHVGYRLYFSDNNVATINDTNTPPHATERTVYVRYDTPGTYQLTIVANDVTHASYTWNVEVVDGNPAQFISITGSAAVGIDNTAQLTANVIGVNKDEPASVTDLIWSVSDEDIATVDQNGLLTAKATGEVTIYATSADPATPKVVGGLIINITKGEALKFTTSQLVAQNRTIYDSSSEKWGTITNARAQETDLWYFANEDGSMTLTYPRASLDDGDGGSSIANKVAENHYTFGYPGFSGIAFSQQNKIMYGAGMESYMLANNEGASGFMTAVDVPLSINRALNDGSGLPVYDMKPVTKIGNYVFAYSNITVLNIGEIAAEQAYGESIKEIGDYVFLDCTEFLGVPEGTAYEVVPDCITKLGRNVFDGCRNMERMIISEF